MAKSFAASNKGRIHSGGQRLDENGKKNVTNCGPRAALDSKELQGHARGKLPTKPTAGQRLRLPFTATHATKRPTSRAAAAVEYAWITASPKASSYS